MTMEPNKWYGVASTGIFAIGVVSLWIIDQHLFMMIYSVATILLYGLIHWRLRRSFQIMTENCHKAMDGWNEARIQWIKAMDDGKKFKEEMDIAIHGIQQRYNIPSRN